MQHGFREHMNEKVKRAKGKRSSGKALSGGKKKLRRGKSLGKLRAMADSWKPGSGSGPGERDDDALRGAVDDARAEAPAEAVDDVPKTTKTRRNKRHMDGEMDEAAVGPPAKGSKASKDESTKSEKPTKRPKAKATPKAKAKASAKAKAKAAAAPKAKAKAKSKSEGEGQGWRCPQAGPHVQRQAVALCRGREPSHGVHFVQVFFSGDAEPADPNRSAAGMPSKSEWPSRNT